MSKLAGHPVYCIVLAWQGEGGSAGSYAASGMEIVQALRRNSFIGEVWSPRLIAVMPTAGIRSWSV